MSPSRKARLAELFAKPFAHRGLHGAGIIENSRAAFRAAIEAGHGIELDVQAAEYGFAYVFHDYDLDRLSEGHGPIADLEPEQIETIKLRGTDETIPPLKEILSLIGGRAPILIEVKARGPAYHQLCSDVCNAIWDYKGGVAVMSFNPRVGHWFARHFPQFLRGLVVTEQDKQGWRGAVERRLSKWWAKPDFLAYDIRDLPSAFAAASGLPVGTWTVRTEAQRTTAAAHADQIIYERPA